MSSNVEAGGSFQGRMLRWLSAMTLRVSFSEFLLEICGFAIGNGL